MSKFHISVNQLAEFSDSTLAVKTRIVKQQIKPNPVLIPWYSTAKSSIRKYFANVRDTSPLREGIKKVKSRTPQNPRQAIDKKVSIEALEKMLSLPIPPLLNLKSYEVVRSSIKTTTFGDVLVSVSPEIIFRTTIKGQTVYGGVKVHIAKGTQFGIQQCKIIATVLQEHIEKNIAKSDDIVDPELCLSIDLFTDRIVSASSNNASEVKLIKAFCEEVKDIWRKAA